MLIFCPQGKVIPFKKVFYEGHNKNKKKEYRASKYVCLECPMRTSCLKKSQEKRISIPITENNTKETILG
ncbi:transposase [Sabulilitoribacter arenilitoris]|uniref:Transposase n=1 Tax=Wocania arenilitoris TaxID=2044858 RepID=A0AAE3ENS7_9FLAO|nr:transposase [Wocania arenilitoris]